MGRDEGEEMTVVHLSEIQPDRDADNVLKGAVGQYESVVIIGFDLDGEFDAQASLNMTQAQILWLVEQFKMKLLNGDYLG